MKTEHPNSKLHKHLSATSFSQYKSTADYSRHGRYRREMSACLLVEEEDSEERADMVESKPWLSL